MCPLPARRGCDTSGFLLTWLEVFKVLRPDINRSGAGNLPVLSRQKRIELFNMFFMLMTEAMEFPG